MTSKHPEPKNYTVMYNSGDNGYPVRTKIYYKDYSSYDNLPFAVRDEQTKWEYYVWWGWFHEDSNDS